MHRTGETLVLSFVLSITLWSVGCGGPDNAAELAFLKDLVPATGRVTLDGKPLSGATVSFVPDITVEGGRMAMAITDANGAYELVTGVPSLPPEESKGVLPGEYTVAISRIAMPDGKPMPEGITEEADFLAKGAIQFVPEKYTDPNTSTLKATVAPPKAENNFEL